MTEEGKASHLKPRAAWGGGSEGNRGATINLVPYVRQHTVPNAPARRGAGLAAGTTPSLVHGTCTGGAGSHPDRNRCWSRHPDGNSSWSASRSHTQGRCPGGGGCRRQGRGAARLSRPARTAAGSRQGRAVGLCRPRSRRASPQRGRRRHGRLPCLPQRVTRPAAGRGAVGPAGAVGVGAGPGSLGAAGREGTGCPALLLLAGGRGPAGTLGGSPVSHGAPVPRQQAGAGQDRAPGLHQSPEPSRLHGLGSRHQPCPVPGLAQLWRLRALLPAWGGSGRPLSGPRLGSRWVSRGGVFLTF